MNRRSAAFGASLLFMAAQNGHETVVALLLKHDADINKCNFNGVSPLFMAAQNGHEAVVQLLLDHNADPNQRLTLTVARPSSWLQHGATWRCCCWTATLTSTSVPPRPFRRSTLLHVGATRQWWSKC